MCRSSNEYPIPAHEDAGGAVIGVTGQRIVDRKSQRSGAMAAAVRMPE